MRETKTDSSGKETSSSSSLQDDTENERATEKESENDIDKDSKDVEDETVESDETTTKLESCTHDLVRCERMKEAMEMRMNGMEKVIDTIEADAKKTKEKLTKRVDRLSTGK